MSYPFLPTEELRAIAGKGGAKRIILPYTYIQHLLYICEKPWGKPGALHTFSDLIEVVEVLS